MIGLIERIKNNVLLKCSTLNDEIINKQLVEIIDKNIYYFAEDIVSLLNDTIYDLKEENIRESISSYIKLPVIKKIKRKLFIDSLALQITNDLYIEKYVNNKIKIDKLKREYVKELNSNKNSNQLNMTEDLNLDQIFEEVENYINNNIYSRIKENNFMIDAIKRTIDNFKTDMKNSLDNMLSELDLNYLDILVNEINEEIVQAEEKNIEDEGDINMFDKIEESNVTLDNATQVDSSKFEKYDDMTLFNKTILALNTKEEKMARKEKKLEKRRQELEEKLAITNKNIETNISRENELSQRKIELNDEEIRLNSKLSEVEVIFLNMKPLIKGLNSIKSSDNNGGAKNE